MRGDGGVEASSHHGFHLYYLKRSRQRPHALLTHPNFHLSPDTCSAECLTLACAWEQAFQQQSFLDPFDSPDGIEKPIPASDDTVISPIAELCPTQTKVSRKTKRSRSSERADNDGEGADVALKTQGIQSAGKFRSAY